MPRALENKPKLHRWNTVYLSSFYDLSPSRSHSDSPHPLTFSDIITYGRLFGIIGGQDLLFFYRMVRICDDAYLNHHQDIRESENPAK